MSQHEDVIREARERINALLDPTREELARVEALIEEHELAIAELKPLRLELKAVIAKLDPTAPTRGRRKTPQQRPGGGGAEAQDAIAAWVRANKNGEPFTARDLTEAGLRSQTVINKALNRMAELGTVRLVKVDPHGGRRTYQLTQ